jgi:plastocyanin
MRKALVAAFVAVLALAAQPAFAATTTIQVKDEFFSPATVSIRQADSVKWAFNQFNGENHTATDSTGMGLFDSKSKPPGQTFTFLFKAAGNYPFLCTIHPWMTGTVMAALKVNPSSGHTNTVFTITWASAAITGYKFDVQYKFPGSSSWHNLFPGTTLLSNTFTPDHGTGTYQFHSRLHKTSNGKTSGYSAAKSISVT